MRDEFKAPVLGLYDRIPFGKYKGCTVEQVLVKDKAYLDWAIEHRVLELDNRAYEIYSAQ
jgi:hypothetical protein